MCVCVYGYRELINRAPHTHIEMSGQRNAGSIDHQRDCHDGRVCVQMCVYVHIVFVCVVCVCVCVCETHV